MPYQTNGVNFQAPGFNPYQTNGVNYQVPGFNPYYTPYTFPTNAPQVQPQQGTAMAIPIVTLVADILPTCILV